MNTENVSRTSREMQRRRRWRTRVTTAQAIAGVSDGGADDRSVGVRPGLGPGPELGPGLLETGTGAGAGARAGAGACVDVG